MKLIIAEKNEVAKAVLGSVYQGKRTGKYWTCQNDVIIFSVNGHMMRLKMPEEYNSNWDLWKTENQPLNFVENYEKVPIESRKEDFDELIGLMKKADLIIHAGDCDDEGQIIVDEIYSYARKYHKVTIPVKRVFIRDNEPNTVRKAFNNLVDNETQVNVGLAAEGKAVLDLLFGLNLTCASTAVARRAGYDGVMYCGRVQSAVQGLVVRRDREIESHKKSSYHNLTATFMIDNQTITARYKISDTDPVDEKRRIINKDFVENIGENIIGANSSVISNVTTVKEASAILPFNMAVALATFNRMYKLPIPVIDETLQGLRLKHNLITYSRSDCRYLSEEIFENAPNILASVASNDSLLGNIIQKADTKFRSKAIDSKKAPVHHGIIPTAQKADLSQLTEVERNIYTVICKTFIAQFMPLHKYEHTKLLLDTKGYVFEATSSKTLVNGWKEVFDETDKDDDSDASEEVIANIDLQTIKAHHGVCSSYEVKDKVTAPKKKYTVASLLKDMNSIAKYCIDPKIRKLLLDKDSDNSELQGSIGTSATQKEIVPAQFAKGMFIEDSKGNITSTKICRDLFDMLPKEITNPDLTALWYEQQKLIEQGQITVKEFIRDSYEIVANQVNAIKNMKVVLSIDVPRCKECGGVLKRIEGKFGWYWYCLEYKNGCNFKAKDNNGKPILEAQAAASGVKTNKICPLCRGTIVKKTGAHGEFESCGNYPTCKYVVPKKSKFKKKPQRKTTV